MKYTTIVGVLAALTLAALMSASAVAAENRSDVSIQGIRAEHHDIKDNDGTVLLTVDAFHRGTNSILEVFTYQKTHGAYAVGGGCRIYRMNGKPVLIEDHKKPDGDAELRVFRDSSDLSEFEDFTRRADGSVRPASSEELGKLKEQAKKDETDVQAFLEVLNEGIEQMKRGPQRPP
jgi:hypothetical protein